MSAVMHTPGAIDHYVKASFNGVETIAYLGTATTAPEIEVRPAYLNVINDLGGRTVPFQKVPDRQQHVITTTLNRFDWLTYKTISRDVTLGGVAQGIDGLYSHGILGLGTAGVDFELILVYTLAGSIFATQFPRGRRYWSCLVLGAKESTVGTRVEEVSLVIEANELFDPLTRAFELYSENPTDVLAGLPTPD